MLVTFRNRRAKTKAESEENEDEEIVVACDNSNWHWSHSGGNAADFGYKGPERWRDHDSVGERANAVYKIEYASALTDGATTFETLFEDYPSHGTNTLWTDNGDYTKEPPIKRPQDAPKRFYRVVQTGTNTSSSNPTVAITSPGNGALLQDLQPFQFPQAAVSC